MADVSEIIDYYVDLLIIQYHNQPKAQATIQLFAKTFLADGILLDIQNAYNLDTAVGKQLDVIGKYVGVDRYFSQLELSNFFSLITYDETGSLPTSPPRWGFTDYSGYSDYQYNGTLSYDSIVTNANALSDADFRTLIRLKIIENNSNYSHSQIDSEIFNVFGTVIRPESTGHMAMQYFIQLTSSTLLQAILFKKLLPKPMGVLLSIISQISGDMFSFTGYDGYSSPFGYGFSDYADYDTLPGEVLSYSQITEV